MPERKIEYEKVDHKLEAGFRIKAPSWERLYVDAGLAVTDMIAKLDRIEPLERRAIAVAGDNREKLMAQWLSAVIALFEKDKFVARRIVFDMFDGKKIKATLTGEIHEPARHGGVATISGVSESIEIGDSEIPEPHFFAKIFLKR